MVVTLHDAKTLRCKFPYSAYAVVKVKALPHRTYEAAAKTWLVPVGDFELLAAAFPDLQASVDVWEAAYPSLGNRLDRALTFCLNLAALGVSVVEQDGRIAAVGEAVSPLLQAEVDARAGLIRRLLVQGWKFRAAEGKGADTGTGSRLSVVGRVEPQAAQDGVLKPLADGTRMNDPLLAAIVHGMRSAAVRAAADAERKAARRRMCARKAAGGDEKPEDHDARQSPLL